MRRRTRIAWIGVVVALGAVVLITPTAEDPEATLALRRYLSGMGFEVADDDRLPSVERTLILLDDLRAVEDAEPLLAWAERGGSLVVADPDSRVPGLLGVQALGPVGFAGNVDVGPSCIVPAVVGVQRIVVRASDRALAADQEGFLACFPVGDGAFLLTRPYGEGSVTLLGGSSPFSNELLVERDNARLAVGLAGQGEAITFASPQAAGAGGSGGVWETLPDRGRAAIALLVAAGIAFALVRARRLGRPVVEEPIAPIPGSELVRAAARMYRRARAAGYAGTLLRDASVTRLAHEYRVSGTEPALVDALASGSGLPVGQVSEALHGPEPRSDDDLINLGRALADLETRAERRSR